MAVADVNAIIQTYLLTATSLVALVGARIYCLRLPEKATLPAVVYFVRGGLSTPYIPGIVTPSFQFDCWAANSIDAREIYRTLYDNLQGIQNIDVGSNQIMSAIEEVQGVDMVDVEIPNYFRVLTFFEIMMRVE